ncbi:FAD-binding protein [Paenibacillus sp. P22]|uniref:FAD-binding protein n=1 Tax=Paenibacillus sp. P22 TaxID=483908 RepID=UPI0022B69207|nr:MULTISPECIES: FAD-binding protein [unclassified Paenibacillus]
MGRIAKTLAPLGYIAPFGDSPTVGIGGITLGGGIGPLQRTVGLVRDNLIGLEMVDAKGRVIRANKKRNSDLLWASKGGGGGNFGVYTRYKFKVHSAPEKATVYRITSSPAASAGILSRIKRSCPCGSFWSRLRGNSQDFSFSIGVEPQFA